MSSFKDAVIKLLFDQATVYKEEKINPYLYEEILRTLYDTGSLQPGQDITLEDRELLDKHCEYLHYRRLLIK